MRLKLSWDFFHSFFFFCTLSHWELGTSKLLTRVHMIALPDAFWYAKTPVPVIQSVLLKWISDYWSRVFIVINFMAMRILFSIVSMLLKTLKASLPLVNVTWQRGLFFYSLQTFLSSHVFCQEMSDGSQWPNLFSGSMFDCGHSLVSCLIALRLVASININKITVG